MESNESGLGTPCSHDDYNAFHLEVLAWAKEWAVTLHAEALAHAGEEHGAHEYCRIYGEDFLKARPERFRGCNLARRAFVEDVLACLHSGVDPVTMLVLKDGTPAKPGTRPYHST